MGLKPQFSLESGLFTAWSRRHLGKILLTSSIMDYGRMGKVPNRCDLQVLECIWRGVE